ncbi:hypothetical protein BDN67DRAFT_974161 [Paxillus ammoniavirescens]|nr:hypothetical protein BDN67DRAFT_974161 [Paxillus ammoniavirescens]
MASTGRQTVILKGDYGSVKEYDRNVFPLSSYKDRDKLGRGDLFLDATLDEMLKIASMGKDDGQHEEVIQSTKDEYDRLRTTVTDLKKPPTKFQLLKRFRHYRASRIFLAATKTLYFATRNTSEEIRRTVGRKLLSLVGADLESVDDASPDAHITGIAVNVDGPLSEEASKILDDAAKSVASRPDPLTDPFINKLSSVCEAAVAEEPGPTTTSDPTTPSDDEIANRISIASTLSQALLPASPTSGTSINCFFFGNSVMAPNSNVHGATLMQGGSQNSGSVNNDIQMTPETLPSASS